MSSDCFCREGGYPTLRRGMGMGDKEQLAPVVGEIQQLLNDVNNAGLKPDGKFGKQTESAVRAMQSRAGFKENGEVRPPLWVWLLYSKECLPGGRRLPWGEKVSEAFQNKVLEIGGRLSDKPEFPGWLMGVMAFETDETFDPSIRNMAGSGAVGLIQFMPFTCARLLGMNPFDGADTREAAAQFEEMTALQQLEYVERYFRPYKGKLNSLEDTYMAVLYPAAVGKPQDYVLFSGGVAYRQNAGLDFDDDGQITKEEATSHVRKAYGRGREYAT